MSRTEKEGVIIEYTAIGQSLKVTAVCTRTGDEVAMVADPSAPKSHVEALAIRKLRFVQSKRHQ